MRTRSLAVAALLLSALPGTSPAASNLTLTVLYRFAQSAGTYPQGSIPLGRLVQGTDGVLYGVTNLGGAFDYGTVFKVTAAGDLTTLHSFTGGDDGSYPADGLAFGPDGNLYGSTAQGGATWGGTLFRISPAGAFATLVSLPNGGPGPYFPQGAMVPGGDGALYGTTQAGGGNQAAGSVFQLTTGGAFTVLKTFPLFNAPLSAPDGFMPTTALVRGSDGYLYGTTAKGGSAAQDQFVLGHGTVFRISTGGSFASLHSFTGGVDGGAGDEGSVPMAALVQGSDGFLYGTTSMGGTHVDGYGSGWGTVFSMSTGGALSTLHSFTGGGDGGHPYDALVQGGDGNLYGTTRLGGLHQTGTVFRITPQGALTTLFSARDASGFGDNPNGLIEGADGRLYGTTQGPGSGGGPGGTIFRISGLPAPPALAIPEAALPGGVVGAPYGAKFAAEGGTPPYAWSVASGEVPPGLLLAGDLGTLNGIPSETGLWSFVVKVTDAGGGSATAAVDLEIHPAPPPADTRFLRIDRLQLGFPASEGRDTFLLQGSLNRWFGPAGPGATTLALDTGWSVEIPASAWKRSGASDVFTASVAGVSAKVSCWSKGSTKWLFTFSGKSQSLQGRLPHLPSLPVTLRMGGGFDETVTAEVAVKGRAARLSTIGAPPVFWADRVSMAHDPKRAGRDSVALTGRLFLERAFDPATDGITVGVGAWSLSLPAGSLPAAEKGVVRYAAATPTGKITLQIDGGRHLLSLKATGLDLPALDGVTRVSLSVSNHPGADWDLGLFLPVNGKGTSCRY